MNVLERPTWRVTEASCQQPCPLENREQGTLAEDPTAPVKPSDGLSLGGHLHHNLRRVPVAERCSWTTPEFLTLGACVITNLGDTAITNLA